MTVETFDASTTWTCPNNVTDVQVECWGAGSHGVGFGGGGGAYARKNSFSVTPSTGYTVTVAAANTTQSSSFDDGLSVLAVSAGVGSQTGGDAASCIGDVTFSGGNGGNQDFIDFSGGGGGSSAGSAANGNNGNDGSGTTGGAGGTAPTDGGAGGNGGDTGANGSNASAPGGGGGGMGNGGTTEGNGAAGRVRLTYTAATVLDWFVAATLPVLPLPLTDPGQPSIDAGTLATVSQAPTVASNLANQLIRGGSFR